MKKIIILCAALLLLLNGCGGKCCTAVSTAIFLKYQNKSGEDLLDPRTPNALKEDDVELYVVKDGMRVLLLDNRKASPKNFHIYGSSTEKYYMQLGFDISKGSLVKKKVTMFISYKDGSEDKFVGEFNVDNGNTLLQNVWINDVERGRPSHLSSEAFVLKK